MCGGELEGRPEVLLVFNLHPATPPDFRGHVGFRLRMLRQEPTNHPTVGLAPPRIFRFGHSFIRRHQVGIAWTHFTLILTHDD